VTDIRSPGLPAIGPHGTHAKIPNIPPSAIVRGPADVEDFITARLADGAEHPRSGRCNLLEVAGRLLTLRRTKRSLQRILITEVELRDAKVGLLTTVRCGHDASALPPLQAGDLIDERPVYAEVMLVEAVAVVGLRVQDYELDRHFGLADVEATAVVYGWMMRVIRNGEAALQLVDAGYGPEASPLIRSMIEHAIGLWWIVDQPGAAFQALTRARSETMRRLHAAQATGWVIGDDESQRLLQEAINIVTDEDTRAVDRLLHIAHQAAQYNLGRLYQA